MNIVGLKELLGNSMLIFFTILAITYLMHAVATRMNVKRKRIEKQQTIRIALKVLKNVY